MLNTATPTRLLSETKLKSKVIPLMVEVQKKISESKIRMFSSIREV